MIDFGTAKPAALSLERSWLVVAPLLVLDLMFFKDRFRNLGGANRSRPHDCYNRSPSGQPSLFDSRLRLQVYQERLGPAATAARWRSAAHQGNVVESDDFVVNGIVHGWTQRLSGK